MELLHGVSLRVELRTQKRLTAVRTVAILRDLAAAVRQLEEIAEQDPQNIFALVELARAYGEQGNLRAARLALEWLDAALRNADERAEWFSRNPLLASVRNEPRVKQILDSIARRRESGAKAPGTP